MGFGLQSPSTHRLLVVHTPQGNGLEDAAEVQRRAALHAVVGASVHAAARSEGANPRGTLAVGDATDADPARGAVWLGRGALGVGLALRALTRVAHPGRALGVRRARATRMRCRITNGSKPRIALGIRRALDAAVGPSVARRLIWVRAVAIDHARDTRLRDQVARRLAFATAVGAGHTLDAAMRCRVAPGQGRRAVGGRVAHVAGLRLRKRFVRRDDPGAASLLAERDVSLLPARAGLAVGGEHGSEPGRGRLGDARDVRFASGRRRAGVLEPRATPGARAPPDAVVPASPPPALPPKAADAPNPAPPSIPGPALLPLPLPQATQTARSVLTERDETAQRVNCTPRCTWSRTGSSSPSPASKDRSSAGTRAP